MALILNAAKNIDLPAESPLVNRHHAHWRQNLQRIEATEPILRASPDEEGFVLAVDLFRLR